MQPKRNRLPLVIAGVLHVVVLGSLIFVRARPVRVSPEGSPSGGIAAYISGPISGTPAAASRPEPKKTALKTEAVKNAPKDEQSDAGTAVGTAGVAGQVGSGPVRLGSGGNITLLKKVQPVYPGAFQSARVPGQVTLDAIIHADGTIGDITILRFDERRVRAVRNRRRQAVEGRADRFRSDPHCNGQLHDGVTKPFSPSRHLYNPRHEGHPGARLCSAHSCFSRRQEGDSNLTITVEPAS